MRRVAALLVLLAACGGPPPPSDTFPGCRVDSDCDDGLFCNGTERCDPRTLLGCLPGTPPCAMGCDEARGCVSCEPPDADADGVRARACGGADCDDTSPLVLPGAPERCNGEDDDCDRLVDEELMDVVLYLDRDGDGHGDPASPVGACTTLSAAAAGDDCDDGDPSVSPSAPERCNGLDDDCSGTADDAAPEVLCALLGVASASCDAGVCTLARCEVGRGDCNGRGDDGCEIDTTNDVRHCGACDAPCTSTEGTSACTGGACDLAVCPDGRHICGGRCVSDLSTDSCGARCTPCAAPVGAHGGARCDGSSCRMYCDPGYGDTPEGDIECLWLSSALSDLVPSEGAYGGRWVGDRANVLELPPEITEVRFTPVTDPRAEVTIDLAGVRVAANALTPSFALAPGSNPLSVHVTSTAGRESAYFVDVRRGLLARTELIAPRSDGFGTAIAATTTTLVVGAPYYREGRVRVHERAGDAWLETAVLTASSASAGDLFGSTIAMDGDRVAVGAPGKDGLSASEDLVGAGAVYVFRREGASWVEEAFLEADAPRRLGSFGQALELSGDLLAVAQPNEYPMPDAVTLFRRIGTTWTREARIDAPSSSLPGSFANTIALVDGYLFVGDPSDATGAGTVHVYASSSGTWSEVALVQAPVPTTGEQFGTSIAASDRWLVVGAPYAPGVEQISPWGVEEAGVVYVFSAPDWDHVRTLRAPIEWEFPDVVNGVRFGTVVELVDGGLFVGGWNRGFCFDVDPAFAPTALWPVRRWELDVAITRDELLLGQSGARIEVFQRYR